MIVRPMKDSVRLIPQHDHARAAGSLLRHWVGLDSVPALNSELAVAVWFAVDNHDVGWCKPDENPSYDPVTKLPYSFFGTSSEDATEIWSRGIAVCADYHPLSGYLVSAHFSQLAEVGGRGAPSDVLEHLGKFIRVESNRQKLLSEQFTDSEEAGREGASLLLRTCDTLSLLMCRAPEISPPEGQTHPMTRCGLKIRASSGDCLEILPWPFDVECLELQFPGTTIPGPRFENAEEFQEAMERAEPEVFHGCVMPIS